MNTHMTNWFITLTELWCCPNASGSQSIISKEEDVGLSEKKYERFLKVLPYFHVECHFNRKCQ